jgi:hypothetical protein
MIPAAVKDPLIGPENVNDMLPESPPPPWPFPPESPGPEGSLLAQAASKRESAAMSDEVTCSVMVATGSS